MVKLGCGLFVDWVVVVYFNKLWCVINRWISVCLIVFVICQVWLVKKINESNIWLLVCLVLFNKECKWLLSWVFWDGYNENKIGNKEGKVVNIIIISMLIYVVGIGSI